MKIKELIEELQAFNQNATVTTSYSETIKLSWIAEDGDKDETKKTTCLVFIDGCDLNEDKYI